MILQSLTDAELVRIAQAEIDDLTSTPLEVELLRRFDVLATRVDSLHSAVSAIEDLGYDLDTTDDIERLKAALQAVDLIERECGFDIAKGPALERLKGLLDAALDHDLDNADALRAVLSRDAKFRSLMTDLAEPLASLQALTEEA